MTDKKLIEIYKKAKYIALLEDGVCRLRVGLPSSQIDTLLDKYETQTAYFITPENPFSQTIGETENRLRHQRFVSALLEKNLSYIEGYGTDEDDTWPKEHSYLVFCSDAEAMHTLAANFGQKGMLKLAKKKPVSILVFDDMHYKEAI